MEYDDKIQKTLYISNEFLNEIKALCKKDSRSFNAEILYLVKLGVLLEKNPEFKLQLQLSSQLQ